MGFNFTKPIDDLNTRDEVLLVKYSGCIKNVGEMMFNAAKERPNFTSYWMERYPKFSALLDKKDEEVFNLLAPFNGAEFLKYMCLSLENFSKLEFDTTLRDYAQLMSLCNPYRASTTNIEMMLKNIISYPFCRKMYIYDTAFNEPSKMYLREIFGDYGNKISLIEGTLYDILDEKKDITTCFSDSVGEVCEVIQSEPEGSDKYAKKLFMISALPSLEFDKDGKLHYKYEKFLSETIHRFKCETRWFQLKYVNHFDFTGPEIKLEGEN